MQVENLFCDYHSAWSGLLPPPTNPQHTDTHTHTHTHTHVGIWFSSIYSLLG